MSIITADNFPCFKNYTEEEREALFQFFRIQKFSAGTVIFEENDRGRDIYFLTEGKVGIDKKLNKESFKLLAEILPGDFFGEMGFIEHFNRSARAIALENCVTASIDWQQMSALIESNTALFFSFFSEIGKNLNERLRMLNRHYIFTRKVFESVTKHSDNIISDKQHKALFESFNIEEMDILAQYISFEEFAADQVVFREHRPGDSLGIVYSGKIRIQKFDDETKNFFTLAYCEPGNVFGEMSFIDSREREASCIAETQSTIIFLSQENFARLQNQVPSLAMKLLIAVLKKTCFNIRITNECFILVKQKLLSQI